MKLKTKNLHKQILQKKQELLCLKQEINKFFKGENAKSLPASVLENINDDYLAVCKLIDDCKDSSEAELLGLINFLNNEILLGQEEFQFLKIKNG